MVISDVRDGKFYWLLAEKENSGKLCIYLNLVDSTTNSSLVVAIRLLRIASPRKLFGK